ncbi:MAG: alanyl-tRNA editing protein [Candidatus Heimdallarchaeota archaeon]|nr:alanyl-tRNA editing protein [Candidatus Heimdallarchaeota archaeon]
MTKLLYLEDSYLKETEATIIFVNDEGIIPDQTICYPRGGGQPEDKAIIMKDGVEYPVSGYAQHEMGLLHKMDGDLKIGDTVSIRIDWEYRYALIKHHTALHLLSAIVDRKYNHPKVTGGNIYHDRARLDFDLPEFTKQSAIEVVEELNSIIPENHEVSTFLLSREEAEKDPNLFKTTVHLPQSIKEFRMVRIGDIDLQADGGLHVKSTAEIGTVMMVKTENKGKGRKRVTIAIE